MDLTDKTELFVDKYLIDDIGSARLCLNNPKRREIVLSIQEPWEGEASFVYSNLVAVEGELRLYYRGWPRGGKAKDSSELQTNCLAVSEDGINFRRPKLGVVEHSGNKQNNIVFGGSLAHNFSPFYDTNPDCLPDEHFKAVCGFAQTGLFLFVSSDGIHWKQKYETPIITGGAFDSLNIVFFDNPARLYRCYYRYFENEQKAHNVYQGVRAIASAYSKDLLNWSKPAENQYDDKAPVEHLYTNNTVACPGAEHIFLSFPMRFMPERKKVSSYNENGVSDNVFMTSRDGVYWDRTFAEPWVRPSMDIRCWTQRNHNPVRGIFVKDNVMNFYVTEHYEWDDCHIRRYTLPMHRFASIRGDYSGATVITKPFTAKADRLLINYASSAAGDISFAVLDESKNMIDGFTFDDCGEIYGNELDYEVKWGSNSFSQIINKKIRLAIKLKEADLYAITLK